MDTLSLLFGRLGLHVLGAIAAGSALFLLVRWIHRESPLIGVIVAAGLVTRAVLGSLLFWISYLDVRLLRNLHTSDGFWIVAPDASDYFLRAAKAAEVGLDTIEWGSASPGYVFILSMWMRLVGISPASGLFLNVALFTLLSSVIVYMWKPARDWRHDLPCIVLLFSFAFAPSLVIHSTQSLKDDMFAFFIATGSIGVLVTTIPIIYGGQAIRSRWISLVGVVVLMVAVYYAAGIRSYFAFFMLASLTGVLVLFAPRLNVRDFARTAVASVVVVMLTAASYARGAGAYDFYLLPLLGGGGAVVSGANPASTADVQKVETPAAAKKSQRPSWTSATGLVRTIEVARIGFRFSGGGTNVAPVQPERVPVTAPSRFTPPAAAVPAAPDDAPAPTARGSATGAAANRAATPTAPVQAAADPVALAPTASIPAATVPAEIAVAAPSAPAPAPARASSTRSALLTRDFGTAAKQLLVGIGTLYVPISLMRVLSIVTFSGGRGLLAITDIDTVFLDLTVAATLFLLYRRWSISRRYLPYVMFLLVLSLTSAVLMAYVVTNFGTIFRLRMMTVVPIWMLAMAMTSGRFMLRSAPGQGAAASAPALAGKLG